MAASGYFAGMWPPSFDIALDGKRAAAREPSSLAYLKKIVFLNPKWIVTWDEDYSDLQDYMRFVKSFTNVDPDIRIVEAGELRVAAHLCRRSPYLSRRPEPRVFQCTRSQARCRTRARRDIDDVPRRRDTRYERASLTRAN